MDFLTPPAQENTSHPTQGWEPHQQSPCNDRQITHAQSRGRLSWSLSRSAYHRRWNLNSPTPACTEGDLG